VSIADYHPLKLTKIKTKIMKDNYFQYWYKRLIKDGLKAIKTVIGLGIAVALWYSVNLPIGIMFFGYVLVDSLIDRN
jgi:hypothetical protein